MGIDARTAERAEKALAVLADLSPAARQSEPQWAVPLEYFSWTDRGHAMIDAALRSADPLQRSSAYRLLRGYTRDPEEEVRSRIDVGVGNVLLAVQQLREGREAVRLGWLWITGTVSVTGPTGDPLTRRYFHPIVSRPIRVERGGMIAPYGDVSVTPLITDPQERMWLAANVATGGGAFDSGDQLTPRLYRQLPRLRAYVERCCAALGVNPGAVTLDLRPAEELMLANGLQLTVGLGLYVAEEPTASDGAGLASWTAQRLGTCTAFHGIYAADPGLTAEEGADSTPVEGPLPLTPHQVEAIRHTRDHRVTVISGAPGTGKSHTLVSLVCDSLRRGESVLVAAKNLGAADALVDLLDKQPGISPVLFGNSDRRRRLTEHLTDGSLKPATTEATAAARQAFTTAIGERDQARRVARSALGAADEDVTEQVQILLQAERGWGARRRRRAAEQALRERLHAGSEVPLDRLLRLALADAASTPASSPDVAGAALFAAEQRVRQRLTSWLDLESRSPDRLNRKGLAAIATLATALRSSRSARRVQLQRLSQGALTRALPVWIGTLGDVDDLLPPSVGLFDLLLIDEASSVDQPLAAPALLRAKRVVIVGDPRQLRHTSFLGDSSIEAAYERHQVATADRSQLDVRRNSLYDAAAAVSPPILLDEHFRSAPHLIDVVARTIYRGSLKVATRTPLTENRDCVELVRVDGERAVDGTVPAEIDAVVELLRRPARGLGSIGVITPFRAQSDVLEQAILAAIPTDVIVSRQIRVGTVHSFAGNERDQVICSLGLLDGDAKGWRFVADPHLLACMLTRAKQSMTIVSSCHPDPTSILGQYLAAADSPPGSPAPSGALSAWAAAIADDLASADLEIHRAYPTGRHVVDIATRDAGRPVAIITDLHPDGIDAHIDRDQALRVGGWTIIDAMSTTWDGDRAAAVLDIIARLDLRHR